MNGALQKNVITFLITLALSVILYKILSFSFKAFTEKVAKNFAKKTATKFDDLLLESNITRLLSSLVFPLAFYSLTFTLSAFSSAAKKTASLLLILILSLILTTLLRVFLESSEQNGAFEGKSYRSYVELASIFIYLVAIIIAFALLSGHSPWGILSGMTVFASVLLLIFKETILAFVSSVHISSYDLVRLGDWIEVEKYGADGDVVEMTLHMIKVQNFDKTFSYVPTNDLLYSGLKNWRGMRKIGARRIKRSIFLDTQSITFVDSSLKKSLIENDLWKIPPHILENSPKCTNLTAFKYYAAHYLRSLPTVNGELTFLIRALEQSPYGLPIELYVFTSTSIWQEYEEIQFEIFSHLYASLPYFSLKTFKFVG